MPECTPLSYNSNKKYTYPGYLCSFINPINQNIHTDDLYQHRENINNTQITNQVNNLKTNIIVIILDQF